MPFKAAYMLRPGVVQPLHGVHSRTAAYRVLESRDIRQLAAD
jgi:hypothetical protein